MTSRKRTKKRRNQAPPKPVALYHDMAVYENFERCAQRVLQVVQLAEKTSPGAARRLYFDVQGHKNSAGGYDHDAYEMMMNFLMTFIMPHLTELSTPLYHVRNPRRQDNAVPDELHIQYPAGETGFWYDVNLLPLRPRDSGADSRRSPPTQRAIADYLGMTEACCLICFRTPVERAHVVPLALGGSMDLRNFSLLCKDHHRQAPDVADAEAFWAWVDYAEQRDRGSKWQNVPSDLKRRFEALGAQTEMTPREELAFLAEVQVELQNLYGWSESDFSIGGWDLTAEYHHVLDAATGKHFGVDKKVATHAWAYDVARRRLSARSPEDPPVDP